MIKKLAIILLLVGLFCYFIAAVTVLNKPKEGLVCNGVEVVSKTVYRPVLSSREKC